MKRRQNGKRGFTLLELALVMGVIGTIIGAIWWASSNTRELQRENNAVAELQTVSANISALMQGHTLSFGGDGTVITNNMISAQAVPETYIDSIAPTTADNPWSKGNFIIKQVGANGSRQYRLTFLNVTSNGCIALLLQGTACQARESGCPIAAFTGGGASPTDSPNAVTGWATVMTPTEAANLCGTAYNSYSGGTNSVEFNYQL